MTNNEKHLFIYLVVIYILLWSAYAKFLYVILLPNHNLWV